MKRTIHATVVLALITSANAFAQALPTTDVWLLDRANGLWSQAVKISDGDGYNNQPHFSDDGKVIYYTREMPAKDGAQTDVAAYRVDTGVTTMLNATTESEYSPTPIPGRNAVSVIRADLEQKQLLCAIDIDTGEMDVLFPTIEPVGYHVWFDDDAVAMFILGDSFTLQTARLGEQNASVVADNIGRSLRKHPASGEVLFVDKNPSPWQIAAFDPENVTVNGVMPLFPGNEDFTIDSRGNYWTANGSKLYRRSPGDNRWNLVAELKAHGIGNISRLAVHLESGTIALVSD